MWEALTTKGGENLNGSEEEGSNKGSTKEGSQEEIGTLQDRGDRNRSRGAEDEAARFWADWGLITAEKSFDCCKGQQSSPTAGGVRPPPAGIILPYLKILGIMLNDRSKSV